MPLNVIEKNIAHLYEQENPKFAKTIRSLRDRGAEKSQVVRVVTRMSRNAPVTQNAMLCLVDAIWEEEEETEEAA